MDYYSGKVVWVTGAGSGLGEALARELARRGARLILSGRNREKLQSLAGELEASSPAGTEAPGKTVEVLAFDLGDPDSLPAQAEKAAGLFGKIDILINNAGISQRSAALETDLPVIRKIMATNFWAPVILSRGVLPGMIRRGGGRIIVVSSIAGKFAAPLRSGYSASKMALQGYFDALRGELAGGAGRKNIRISLVFPGFVRTSIDQNALTGDGTPHGRRDPNQAAGWSPRRCAAHILRQAESGPREIFTAQNLKSRTALFLHRFFPSLFSRIISRAKVL